MINLSNTHSNEQSSIPIKKNNAIFKNRGHATGWLIQPPGCMPSILKNIVNPEFRYAQPMAASQLQTFGILMSFTSMRLQTFGILSFLFCVGNSAGQKTSINSENYYSYLLPNEKVFYLTDGEIKIILTGELQRLGYTVQDNSWYLVSSSNKLNGKLALTIQSKQSEIPTGIFLYGSAVPTSKSDREEIVSKKVYLRQNEHSDPLECNAVELNKSCYWYQRNIKSQKKEFVSRTIIVEVLQADIKKMVDAINKK